MDLLPIWFWPLRAHDAHDDLQLELGDFCEVYDSYFFRLDKTLIDQTDIFGALARFLDLWIAQLDKLYQRPGETFLPFGVHDECSDWLRVHTRDTLEATVEAGSKSIGWFLPSHFAAYVEHGFSPWGGTALTCGLNDLVATITENRDTLNSRSQLSVDLPSRRRYPHGDHRQ
jgi:hypothetical protein